MRRPLSLGLAAACSAAVMLLIGLGLHLSTTLASSDAEHMLTTSVNVLLLGHPRTQASGQMAVHPAVAEATASVTVTAALTGTPTASTTATPTATSTATATATSTATPACEAGWLFVQGPTPNTEVNSLRAVVTLSENDAWAIGYTSYPATSTTVTLIEHWDGLQWSIVPSPNPDNIENILNDIKAISPNDIWAVGYYSIYVPSAFLIHWNGVHWSLVPTPPSLANNVELSGLDIISPTDMWVVGNTTSATFQTFTAHYDGSTWSVVPSPNMGTADNGLSSVSAASSNDVWAVGSYVYDTLSDHRRTLTMHWDGLQWSIVPNPDAGLNRAASAVKAISSNNVWLVGGGYDDISPYSSNMTMHWNGTAWALVPTANAIIGFNTLEDLSVVSPNDIWAVGYKASADTGQQRSEVIHWDGAQWSVVPNPNPGSGRSAGDFFWGISAISHTRAWAVGEYATVAGAGIQALTEQLKLQFTDVLPGSPFFPYITDLDCAGIIGGYSSGCDTGAPCFKQGRSSTRGQISKIVSLAAGFNDPVSGQTFQDVPPGSTFYTYTERMAERSIISGYPCGNANEPCVPPNNRPYFRTNNLVTRGQLSKMTALAFGWDSQPVGQQFQDVPPGSTFYTYIAQLYSRTIISGYSCGGPGETCVPPGNLPYFRPNNNVTRGQTAKIIQLARTSP